MVDCFAMAREQLRSIEGKGNMYENRRRNFDGGDCDAGSAVCNF